MIIDSNVLLGLISTLISMVIALATIPLQVAAEPADGNAHMKRAAAREAKSQNLAVYRSRSLSI